MAMKSNVTNITDAITTLKRKHRSPKQRRQGNPTTSLPKEPRLKDVVVPDFPAVPGLDPEKKIISEGMLALNKALFEQTIYESARLGKIRAILHKVEGDILDEDVFDQLDPVQKLRVFEALRKDSESTVNFLERMQRNSMQVMVIFELYKKLCDSMESTSCTEEESMSGVPEGIDKSKVMEVKGVLLDFMSKQG